MAIRHSSRPSTHCGACPENRSGVGRIHARPAELNLAAERGPARLKLRFLKFSRKYQGQNCHLDGVVVFVVKRHFFKLTDSRIHCPYSHPWPVCSLSLAATVISASSLVPPRVSTV